MLNIKQSLTFLFSLMLISMFIACDGGSTSSQSPESKEGEINFTAQLSSDFFIDASPSDLKIVAVPIDGMMSAALYDKEILSEALLDAEGSFSINLPKKQTLEFDEGPYEFNADYVLLIVDERKPAKDQIVGFVSMADFNVASKIGLGGLGSVETIVKIPVNNSNENIDAGILHKANGNEAMSSTSTGGEFSLTIDQLKQIARVDDITKSVKNEFVNPNIETQIFYGWKDIALTNFSELTVEFSKPGNFNFTGCSIGMWEMTWASGIFGTLDSIVNKTTSIALYPPSAVLSSGGKTYGPDLPISNDGTFIGSNDRFNDDDFSVDGSDTRLQLGFGINLMSLPSGEWILKKGETQIGSYDFAVGNPFVDNASPVTSKISTYVPAIKISVDSGNIITGIDIEWYLYINSTYQKVTDLSILIRDKYSVGLGISITNSPGVFKNDMPVEKTSYTSSEIGIENISLSDLKGITIQLFPGPFSYGYTWGSGY